MKPTSSGTHRAFNAARWTTTSFAANTAAQFIQVATLARVLPPHQLGLIAFTAILAGFIDLFVGMGISQSIIQRKRHSSFEISSLYWLNIFIAIAAATAFAILAPLLAPLFGITEGGTYLRLAAIVFTASAFGQVSRAVLEKRLAFREIAIAETAGSAMLLITTIGGLTAGLGIYSAIAALITAALTRNVIYRHSARRYFQLRVHFKPRETRRFLSFGILQSLDSVLNYAFNNISTVLTGTFVGQTALGGYNLAYNTAVNMPAKVNPIVTRIMFPLFAMFQDDQARMRRGYISVNTVIALTSFAPLVGVALSAPEVMSVLYGPAWTSFAPVLVVLCAVGVLRGIGNPLGFIVMATGQMRLGLVTNIIKAAITFPTIAACAYAGGALGAAFGVLIAQVVGFAISTWMLHRLIALSPWQYIHSVAVGAALTAPMAGALLVSNALTPTAWTVYAHLSINAAVAVIVLATTLALTRNTAIRAARERILPRVWAPSRTLGVAVVLPAEETLEAAGGAISLWVTRVYSHITLPYVIYASREPRNNTLHTHASRVYGAYERMVNLLAGLAARVLPITKRGAKRRLLAGGRLYIASVAPRLKMHDVVHLHNRPEYALWLRKHGFAGYIILHMHNDLADYRPSAAAIRAVDQVVFCSEYLRRKATRDFGALPSIVLYNGVDAVPLAKEECREPLDLAFAGRIIPEKGALEAIRSVERLRVRHNRPYRLHIFGGAESGQNGDSTEYSRSVELKAQRLNEQANSLVVLMHGHLPHDRMLNQLKRCSGFLYPCAWDEPFGLVVLEALAVGCKTVAFARGGLPEVMRENINAVLVRESGDLDAFVNAADAALLNDIDNEARAVGAQVAQQHFSWATIARHTEEVLSVVRQGS